MLYLVTISGGCDCGYGDFVYTFGIYDSKERADDAISDAMHAMRSTGKLIDAFEKMSDDELKDEFFVITEMNLNESMNVYVNDSGEAICTKNCIGGYAE